MVARLFATWLVVLCILPMTAPFATIGWTHDMGRADVVVGAGTTAADAPVAEPAAPDPDDDAALILERSDFSQQSKFCALLTVDYRDGAPVSSVFFAPLAPPSFAVDFQALQTILRL